MEDEYKILYLGLYSALLGVFFTGTLVWGHDLSTIGELAAKLYVVTTGPLWMYGHYKWNMDV